MSLIDSPLSLVTVTVFLFAYGNLGCAGVVNPAQSQLAGLLYVGMSEGCALFVLKALILGGAVLNEGL